jgi:hypothetical protein
MDANAGERLMTDVYPVKVPSGSRDRCVTRLPGVGIEDGQGRYRDGASIVTRSLPPVNSSAWTSSPISFYSCSMLTFRWSGPSQRLPSIAPRRGRSVLVVAICISPLWSWRSADQSHALDGVSPIQVSL